MNRIRRERDATEDSRTELMKPQRTSQLIDVNQAANAEQTRNNSECRPERFRRLFLLRFSGIPPAGHLFPFNDTKLAARYALARHE